MHHLPRLFGLTKETKGMDSKKIRRNPKLERRNAAKFEFDAGSSSCSLDDSSGSLYTQSMELHDRTSFRIGGDEGELDRICRSLGLSGPEDFAIPAAAWEAMKIRSSSDILPGLKFNQLDGQEKKDELKEKEESGVVGELGEKCEERIAIRGAAESGQDEPAETSGCCIASSVCGVVAGGGIKGVRPPMLKPPPGARLPVFDNTCSTWDIFRDFAPPGEGRPLESSDDEQELRIEAEKEEVQKEEEEREVDGVSPKREEENRGEEEDNASMLVEIDASMLAEIVGELSGSCSFTTSNEDDSSSTTTEPRSTNISPNERFRRIITNWQKGELLGRGSFGSVYEGISG